jgi:arabinose-5-phosphate isomerase
MILAKHIMLIHRRAAVGPNATGREVSYRLMSTGLPGLPVINEAVEVIGIVTEFDLLGALREGMKVDEITAERIMSKEPITANMETSAEELIEMMLENNFTVIPIVENKKLVGIVDRFSIMDAYIEPWIFPGFHRYFEE